jgi:very-short-patch-repair endonuclease
VKGKLDKVEVVMAAWAGRQKGNVTREQLLAAGFSAGAIEHRLRNHSLHPMFPGVYLVGHRVEPPLARECAAILYCAPRAMLSHRTAARVWKLPAPAYADVELTVVGRRVKPQPGLRLYTIAVIEAFELRRESGLPITSPSLTLLDLAGVVGEPDLARALNEARVQGLVNDGEIHATLRAHPNRRGARALRALLASEEAEFTVESEAERLCLKLMIKHRMPDAAGAWIGPYRVDFLYDAERLIVEVDGYRYHRTRDRFLRDRRRRADLLTRGYEVFPVTWTDVVDEPAATMTRLRAALRVRRRQLAA